MKNSAKSFDTQMIRDWRVPLLLCVLLVNVSCSLMKPFSTDWWAFINDRLKAGDAATIGRELDKVPDDQKKAAATQVLGLAVVAQNVDVARVALQHGADPNYVEDAKEGIQLSPLSAASGNCNVVLANILIDNGANPNLILKFEAQNATITALWAAVTSACQDTLRITMLQDLIAKGADVNAGTLHAIDLAAAKGHLDEVKVLVGAGANLRRQSFQKLTPLQLATMACQEDVAQYLRAAERQQGINVPSDSFERHTGIANCEPTSRKQ